MNKIILFLMCVILLSLPVMAEPSFVFEENQNSTISIPVYKSDYSKSTTGACTMTVTDPNGSIILDSVTMTQSNHHYQYTIGGSYLSQLGEYGVDVSCTDSDNGFSTFFFEVNQIGKRKNLSPTSLPIMIFLILLNVGLFLLAVKEDLVKNEYVNFILRRCVLVIAFYFMMYNFTVLASLASAADLPVIGDMVWLMEWTGLIGHVFAIYMFVSTTFMTIRQWKADSLDRRVN